MDMNLSKFQEIVKDREASGAAVDRVTKSKTWLSDWTTTTKMHNLKVDNPVLSGRLWGYTWEAMAQKALWDCSEEAKEEPEYIGVLQQKPGCQNIKKLLLKKTRYLKLMTLARFYVWEDASRHSWKSFLGMHLI